MSMYVYNEYKKKVCWEAPSSYFYNRCMPFNSKMIIVIIIVQDVCNLYEILHKR